LKRGVIPKKSDLGGKGLPVILRMIVPLYTDHLTSLEQIERVGAPVTPPPALRHE